MLAFKDAVRDPETTIYNKIKSSLTFIAFIDWPKEYSYVDSSFQSYLLSPQRLGGYSDKWIWDLQKKFVGHVTKEENDEFLMTMGYFWSDTNVSDHEIQRTRKYTHKEMQFPEIDPYKKLYELADSNDTSSFWQELEACQQNRTEAS